MQYTDRCTRHTHTHAQRKKQLHSFPSPLFRILPFPSPRKQSPLLQHRFQDLTPQLHAPPQRRPSLALPCRPPQGTGDVPRYPDDADAIPDVDYPPPMLYYEHTGGVLKLPHYPRLAMLEMREGRRGEGRGRYVVWSG